jgi:hypothetical protein
MRGSARVDSGPKSKPVIKPFEGPAGGYGSLASVSEVLLREGLPIAGVETLAHQNKPGGPMCVSCAWAKPARPKIAEFCENGAKATAWELTRRRTNEAFFAGHTLAELEQWIDHDLEEAGRLTRPMRWDAKTDKYVPVAWEEAFREIGRELAALRSDPRSDGVLRQRSRESGDELSLAALRASLWHQQSARQLEHVPRIHLGGAAREHRRLGRHGDAARLRSDRSHPLSGAQPRHVRAAYPASVAGRRPPRREDHRVQPSARARTGAVPEPAIAQGDGDRPPDPRSPTRSIR